MEIEIFNLRDENVFCSIFKLHLELLFSLSQIDNTYFASPTRKEHEKRLFYNSLSHENTYCIYCKNEKNDIIGYLLSYPCKTNDHDHFISREFAFIDEIYVAPEYRKKSLAKQLILYAKNHFKGLGYSSIELFVSYKNTIARNVYEESGFFIQSIRMECII